MFYTFFFLGESHLIAHLLCIPICLAKLAYGGIRFCDWAVKWPYCAVSPWVTVQPFGRWESLCIIFAEALNGVRSENPHKLEVYFDSMPGCIVSG